MSTSSLLVEQLGRELEKSISELNQELAEEEITRKGYEKKLKKLFSDYQAKLLQVVQQVQEPEIRARLWRNASIRSAGSERPPPLPEKIGIKSINSPDQDDGEEEEDGSTTEERGVYLESLDGGGLYYFQNPKQLQLNSQEDVSVITPQDTPPVSQTPPLETEDHPSITAESEEDINSRSINVIEEREGELKEESVEESLNASYNNSSRLRMPLFREDHPPLIGSRPKNWISKKRGDELRSFPSASSLSATTPSSPERESDPIVSFTVDKQQHFILETDVVNSENSTTPTVVVAAAAPPVTSNGFGNRRHSDAESKFKKMEYRQSMPTLNERPQTSQGLPNFDSREVYNSGSSSVVEGLQSAKINFQQPNYIIPPHILSPSYMYYPQPSPSANTPMGMYPTSPGYPNSPAYPPSPNLPLPRPPPPRSHPHPQSMYPTPAQSQIGSHMSMNISAAANLPISFDQRPTSIAIMENSVGRNGGYEVIQNRPKAFTTSTTLTDISMYEGDLISRFTSPPPPGPIVNFADKLHQWAGKQAMPQPPREVPAAMIDRSTNTQMNGFTTIGAVLLHRGVFGAKATAATVVDEKGKEISSVTWEKIALRAEKIAYLMASGKKGLNKGSKVALVYRRMEFTEFLVAIFGCFLAGCVAVPIVAMETLSELKHVLTVTGTKLVLASESNYRSFAKDISQRKEEWPGGLDWWKTNELGHDRKKRDSINFNPNVAAVDLAYLEFSKNGAGEMKGVGISHRTIMAQCATLKHSLEFPSNNVFNNQVLLSYLDPRQQVGMIYSALFSVYAGYQTVLLDGQDISGGIWIQSLSKYQATLAITEYDGLRSVLKSYQQGDFTNAVGGLSKKTTPTDLSRLASILIDCPQPDCKFNTELETKLFLPLGCHRVSNLLNPMCSLSEHGGMVLSLRDTVASRDGFFSTPSRFILCRRTLEKGMVLPLNEDDPRAADNAQVVHVCSFGYPAPQATVAIVDPTSKALTPAGHVGEVWVDSPALSGGFWGLKRHTKAIFRAQPLLYTQTSAEPLNQEFLRSGLMGTLIQGELVIFGSYEERIRQPLEQETLTHYSPDIVNTLKANIYNIGECVPFEIRLGSHPLLVVALEGRSGLSIEKEEWSSIANQVEKLVELFNHGMRVYCVIGCSPDSLPRTSRHGRPRFCCIEQVKKSFTAGNLEGIAFIRINATTSLRNLVNSTLPDINNIMNTRPQHTMTVKIPQIRDEKTGNNFDQFISMVEVLLWRSTTNAEDIAYSLLDSKGRESKSWTFKKMAQRTAALTVYLMEKGLKQGDAVALIFPHGVDFTLTLYACMAIGVVAFPLSQLDTNRLGEDIPTFLSLVDDLHIQYILTNETGETNILAKPIQTFLKKSFSKERHFPPMINVERASTKSSYVLGQGVLKFDQSWISSDYTALIMVYLSADLRRHCVRISHSNLLAQCRSYFKELRLSPKNPLISCARNYQGFGLIHGCFLGVFAGCSTLLFSPMDYFIHPPVFYEAINSFQVKDVYVTLPMLEHASSLLKSGDYRFNLSQVQSFIVSTHDRPKIDAHEKLVAMFQAYKLKPNVITFYYSSLANAFISSRLYMDRVPQPLRLSLSALHFGMVVPTQQEDCPTIMLQDYGKPSVGTTIAIVDPKTGQMASPGRVGEIWITGECNSSGFIGPESASNKYTFKTKLGDGDRSVDYVRTGDLGFLWPDEKRTDSEQFIYYLGPMDQTLSLERGRTVYFADVEQSVEKCHVNILSEGSMMLRAKDRLVLLLEVSSGRPELLLGMVPVIVGHLFKLFELTPDDILFLQPQQIRKSRLGEKQRDRMAHAIITASLKILLEYHVTPPAST